MSCETCVHGRDEVATRGSPVFCEPRREWHKAKECCTGYRRITATDLDERLAAKCGTMVKPKDAGMRPGRYGALRFVKTGEVDGRPRYAIKDDDALDGDVVGMIVWSEFCEQYVAAEMNHEAYWTPELLRSVAEFLDGHASCGGETKGGG